MGRLEGKVAIITGANSGVGESIAKLFAREGAKVVISARRIDKLETVAQSIKAIDGEVTVVKADISKVDDVDTLVDTAMKTYGKIDIIINNAGVLEEILMPIDKVRNEEIDRIIDINIKGTMYCMRKASANMKSGSSIVNIASVAGVVGNGGAAYVASKAAVIGLSKHTALRFASKQIRCNTICPGSIATPMTMNLKQGSLDDELKEAMIKHNDLTLPICMAEDVANIALFLASDESKAITGQAIIADFGSTL